MPLIDSIPLLHNDDSYILDVEVVSPRLVLLQRILRFVGNHNVDPTDERFFDLDPATRREIIKQINRRYPGKTVQP